MGGGGGGRGSYHRSKSSLISCWVLGVTKLALNVREDGCDMIQGGLMNSCSVLAIMKLTLDV